MSVETEAIDEPATTLPTATSVAKLILVPIPNAGVPVTVCVNVAAAETPFKFASSTINDGVVFVNALICVAVSLTDVSD